MSAAGGASVKSKAVYPAVIPADGSSGAVLTVRTTAPASSVLIELVAGGTVPLASIDAQTFSAALSADQLLFSYVASDVNRNFVGGIKVTDAATSEVSTFNFFVNVDDATIPDVPVESSASDMRCGAHVVNLEVPADDPAGLWDPPYDDIEGVLTRFYEVFGDVYEFVNVVFLRPDLMTNRDHFGARNDVHGIGLPIFNNTAAYGSAGTLLGITRFPLDNFFDLAEPGALHELGHQWINFLTPFPILGAGSPHWPASEPAHGLMGMSIPGGVVGGQFPFKFVPISGNSYTLTSEPPTGVFSPLDLYLMGFIPAHAVPSFVVLDPPGQALIDGTTVTATTVGIDQVIDTMGPRIPDSAASSKHFRMATILVTRTGLLSDREIAFFDYFAARGEAVAPLPFASGFLKGQAFPFPLATQGLGSLDTSVSCPVPIPHDLGDEAAICKLCPPDPCIACNGLLHGIVLVVFPEVTAAAVRRSLNTKIVNADQAYKRGQLTAAANQLDAFLNEIHAQSGKALTSQAADGIGSLTMRAAEVLGIPLAGIRTAASAQQVTSPPR
jgi:hypothetical protein